MEAGSVGAVGPADPDAPDEGLAAGGFRAIAAASALTCSTDSLCSGVSKELKVGAAASAAAYLSLRAVCDVSTASSGSGFFFVGSLPAG